ncbi:MULTISPECIES: thiamine phosphate synthase [unclassified Vibrio]|uniref:Thiamine-phosphate synthase n=1 Tax=Vibrio sp. HB236076 TaxID=3232307 RepID=A0AB39HAQ9_9VIBR|nr:thiamine phosphate synthase [Vibrio sp. HB161653]MDP5255828.1 thiamine phosphate synthase [Vibrio sp. HB161653]
MALTDPFLSSEGESTRRGGARHSLANIKTLLEHHAEVRGLVFSAWTIKSEQQKVELFIQDHPVYRLTVMNDDQNTLRIQLFRLTEQSESFVLNFCPHIEVETIHETPLTPSVWIAMGCLPGAVSEMWHGNDAFDHPGFQALLTSRVPRQWQKSDINNYLAALLISLLQDYSVEDALLLAHASSVSRETWPIHCHDFPDLLCFEPATKKPVLNNNSKDYPPWPEVDREQLRFYPVLPNVEWVKKLSSAGAKTLQLRNKGNRDAHYINEIRLAIELGHQQGLQLFINDDWQLAIELGAYGVHLGQQDLQTADLTAINQANLRLGISTHGYFEILNAMRIQPSYLALGHVFATTTKVMPSKPQGLQRLKELKSFVAQCCPTMPTVAIGGIDLTNAEQIIETGVSSIAVVRAVTEADDLDGVMAEFNQIMVNSKWGDNAER